MKANLLPDELDVDAGEQTGFQFVQSGNTLPIKVRVRGLSGANHAVTAFQVKVHGFRVEIGEVRGESVRALAATLQVGRYCNSSFTPLAGQFGWTMGTGVL